MSFLLTHPALAQLFERLQPDYRIMAPAAEYRGGRFSDTDNVTYHSIRHPADLVWQEKSHFSPKEVVLPITQTLFHFDNLELRESKVEAKPTLLFLRSCDIHALRRLDQVYLKNGQNSDVYYARLRSKPSWYCWSAARASRTASASPWAAMRPKTTPPPFV
ncbi:hypothetical protein ACU6QO_18870 [Aeromonas veronii]|uniref:hypothetical protein n=1 Tax=Aeromonas veronii TaxID=654 RepID=UPI00406CF43E